MNVLLVTQYFWPEDFRINDLAKGLRDRGHTVVILTGNPNYPAGTFFAGYGGKRVRIETWEGMRVIRVPHTARGDNRWTLASNFFSFGVSACFQAAKGQGGPFDVVFVYQPSPVSVALAGLVAKRRYRAPAAMWIQDLWPETVTAVAPPLPYGLSLLLRRIVSRLHKGFDLLLVQSRGFAGPLLKQGVAADHVRYLPNWAEAFYAPVAVANNATQRRDMPDGFRILFAGNIGESQDFPTILDAAELTLQDRDIKWVILGDGREAKSVRQQIAERGLHNVVMLGRRPPSEMPIWFSLADTLLVTLRADPVYALTVPSKVQTYLAAGKPILASIAGCGAEVIVESSSGITVEPSDARALAGAARQMASLGDERRRALGAAGREYYLQHFQRERVITQVENVLWALVSRASA